MSTTEPREKRQDLVADLDTAMLVTRDAGGTVQGRPLQVAEHDEAPKLGEDPDVHAETTL